MDQSNKRGRRSLLWRAVSFHSAKKTDTDLRYYKSAQLIFVLIPLCLIENRVQKRGCLFITAAATAVCTPTSPIQPPAFIVAGNCAAGGKSRPAKLTILTSNERAGILTTNFLQMAIGLRSFPSIFPMAAGRPVRHARQRPPPPSPLLYGNIGMATGERCLQVDLQFCFTTPSNGGGGFLSGLFYPDLSFWQPRLALSIGTQNWLNPRRAAFDHKKSLEIPLTGHFDRSVSFSELLCLRAHLFSEYHMVFKTRRHNTNTPESEWGGQRGVGIGRKSLNKHSRRQLTSSKGWLSALLTCFLQCLIGHPSWSITASLGVALGGL